MGKEAYLCKQLAGLGGDLEVLAAGLDTDYVIRGRDAKLLPAGQVHVGSPNGADIVLLDGARLNVAAALADHPCVVLAEHLQGSKMKMSVQDCVQSTLCVCSQLCLRDKLVNDQHFKYFKSLHYSYVVAYKTLQKGL